jgi:hypothetical protein
VRKPAFHLAFQLKVLLNTGKPVILVLFVISALQSNVPIDFSCLHLYWQGEIFLLPFYYLLYELLLFTWRFCLLLQVWNYLLLLGICALFEKQALFF